MSDFKMRFKDRSYGYMDHTNDGIFVRNIPNQQVGGYAIGIVYIENVSYPFLPGNVVNACTYDFPVRMAPVPGLTSPELWSGNPALGDKILKTAQHMVEYDGVRAICSACGFFGHFHKKIASQLDVPCAMSSLVQIPFILTLLKPDEKILVLTASAASLSDSLLENCFITAEMRKRLVTRGVDDGTGFYEAVGNNCGFMDNAKSRREIVGHAVEEVEKDPSIGAVLLECSDMPPYASDVQRATQLPVFDFITLINWLHNATAQHPYRGWM